MKKLILAIIALQLCIGAFSQMPAAITVEPENATVFDEITLTVDVAQACFMAGSLSGAPYIAIHSGVTYNGAAWQYVINFDGTGVNGQSPILSSNGDDTYSITFIPFEFYGFPAGGTVTQICGVFNNGNNWDQDARDFDAGGVDCMDFFIPILPGAPPDPVLSSIVPGEGEQGESLSVQIFGINTHFTNATTQAWLSIDAETLYFDSFMAVNDTLISAQFTIAEDETLGFWDVNVETPEDGLMTLVDGFKVILPAGTMPAAISIDPPDATAYDELTLTFDPTESCFTTGTLVGATQVFMHSGVGLLTGEQWQYVVPFDTLGANGQSAELTNNGNGTWSITYTPFDFYGFEDGTVVPEICAVFNNGTWDLEGKDFEPGTTNCMDFFIPLNTTQTNIDKNAISSMSIFPNPAEEKLHIISEGNIEKVEIFNQMGKRVLLGNSQPILNISQLSTGIYFILISNSEGEILREKFIKK